MLTKSFNKEELFESIYNESNLKRLNECGGVWTPAEERNYQKWVKQTQKEDELVEDWFEKNISKDDPDYEWLEKALHYFRPNHYYSKKDGLSMVDQKLRNQAELLKKADADEKRKELMKGNRERYMAAHGITPEMERNKKKAQAYESRARSLMKEAEEAQKNAEIYWEKAGGKELWANFRVPKPNKNGEYSDA